MTEHLVLLYLIIVNAAAFLLMLADKLKAKRGAWRIPEATLMGIAAIGGSIGALAGMYLFRHKRLYVCVYSACISYFFLFFIFKVYNFV